MKMYLRVIVMLSLAAFSHAAAQESERDSLREL